MKQVISGPILCSLITFMTFSGCRTIGGSMTKDFGSSPAVGGLPADLIKPTYFVYLTAADSMVHKGECPPETNIGRDCPGLKDVSVLAKLDYQWAIRKTIIDRRPVDSPKPPIDPEAIRVLEDKIARINAKLSAADISDTEKTDLKYQLPDLNDRLQAAKAPLISSQNEQTVYNQVMESLNNGDNVTFDQWFFTQALAAFGEGHLGMTFVTIPSGTFMMGSPDSEPDRQSDEGPQHQVTLTKSFEMLSTEVTIWQFIAIDGFLIGLDSNYEQDASICPGEFTGIDSRKMCPNNPVLVEWRKVQSFINALNNKRDGYLYRLPTEAEWEYAARAGTAGAYAGDLNAMAWYSKNSGYPGRYNMTHPVGRKQPNGWGLYDTQGNVEEWTADWYGAYPSGAITDPSGPSYDPDATYGGSFIPKKVVRGCEWHDTADRCRSANRNQKMPDDQAGFRLVRTKL
jgi:formylglycine-generating enzyme required for sulfatase activity